MEVYNFIAVAVKSAFQFQIDAMVVKIANMKKTSKIVVSNVVAINKLIKLIINLLLLARFSINILLFLLKIYGKYAELLSLRVKNC